MDEKLRRLEKEAEQGDRHARQLLIFYRFRSDQLDPARIYVVFGHQDLTDGPVSGLPARWDEKRGRWRIMDNTDDTSLSIENMMYDVCEEDFPVHLVEGASTDLDDDDFDIINEPTLLLKLRPSNLYHPYGYNKEHITECEKPFTKNQITVLFKPAGQPPQIGSMYTELEDTQELLGGPFDVEHIGQQTFMVTRQMDILDTKEAEPNFVWARQHEPPPGFLERMQEASPEIMGPSGEIITPEQYVQMFSQPSRQIVYGDVVFFKMRVPDASEIRYDLMPWPWREIYEEEGELPPWDGTYSLEAGDIYMLESILGKGVQLLRVGQPIPDMLPVEATHFTMQEQVVGSVGASIYTLDECEKCGGAVKAPDNAHVNATRGELFFCGLQELVEEPAEMGWDEDEEMATCGC